MLTTLSAAGVPAHVEHLAVRFMPGSGTRAVIEQAGLSASHIAAAAKRLLARENSR